VVLLALGSCGYDDLEKYDRDPNAANLSCDEFSSYGTFNRATVSFFSGIREIEAERFERSFVRFELCTGIDIRWEGTGEFEAELVKRVGSGSAPDLAAVPQPGMVKTLVEQGAIKRPSRRVVTEAKKKYSQDWLRYGMVDGTFYAAPLGANVKSFVWYSPAVFRENGWDVPRTWSQLLALTRKIARTSTTTKMKPWCAGIFAPPNGESSGWPGTDWIEDVLLRTADPTVYDQWIDHKIKFNDPKIIQAFDTAGSILRNPRYVNGGFGDMKSINSTSWMEAGLPILDEYCAMSRAASFYASQWPKGTRVEEDGDVYAFYLPSKDLSYRPVLGGGEFVAAFNTRPETQAVQAYLISDEWVNTRAKLGNWISPSKGLVLESVGNVIDQQSVLLLQDPRAVFRFDASDLMPAAVGSKSFWKGMIDWFDGRSTYDTLTYIESSWPAETGEQPTSDQ
jgi:alpha-glucoside transport system substrate-binding protein